MSYNYFYPIQDPTIGKAINTIPPAHWDGKDSVDIAGGTGWNYPVYAAAGGIVVESRWNDTRNDFNRSPNEEPLYSTGNCIAIKITDECELKDKYITYMHLRPNPSQIRTGTQVVKGQCLGRLGNSGHSTGPHLHVQIRNGWWYGDNFVDSKLVVPSSPDLRIKDETTPRGATDYLFRYLKPNIITSGEPASTDDVRLACSIAVLEAGVLGLIGMEEVVAVIFNRVNSIAWKGNSVYEIISAPGQFTVYANNKSFFDSGGYTKAQLDAGIGGHNTQGLYNFASQLFSRSIVTTSATGWAEDYDNRIETAVYFNSLKEYRTGNLYFREVDGFTHWYGDRSSGGST